MLLKELYPEIKLNIEITGVASDTRYLKPGFLFIPIPGKKYSGHEFFEEAVQKGAHAIVFNKHIHDIKIPLIIRGDLEKELMRILTILYNKPYNDLTLIGITGTDGKTSISVLTSYLLSHINSSAYIGTNGINSNELDEENIFTTPLLTKNYELLDHFVKNNTNYVTMEVSSQGILNGRIKGIEYDYAIFSNLSHEHLDTHKTMQNYFNTKFQLFKQLKSNGLAIINKDDIYSKFFINLENVIYYSIFNQSDYMAKNIRYFPEYTLFDLCTKTKYYEDIRINRSEEYNIYNIIPAIIIALNEGINEHILYEALTSLPIVAGRLEKVPIGYPFDVYVDFAHTPNALKNVLSSFRHKSSGNIFLVCGAAGGKDKTKRPQMGQVATSLADYVIFTSEDPRNEKIERILKDLTKEVRSNNYECIINRGEAITKALRMAKAGDIVLVTGKGRENYFEINNTIYPYSDFDYIINHNTL